MRLYDVGAAHQSPQPERSAKLSSPSLQLEQKPCPDASLKRPGGLWCGSEVVVMVMVMVMAVMTIVVVVALPQRRRRRRRRRQ